MIIFTVFCWWCSRFCDTAKETSFGPRVAKCWRIIA